MEASGLGTQAGCGARQPVVALLISPTPPAALRTPRPIVRGRAVADRRARLSHSSADESGSGRAVRRGPSRNAPPRQRSRRLRGVWRRAEAAGAPARTRGLGGRLYAAPRLLLVCGLHAGRGAAGRGVGPRSRRRVAGVGAGGSAGGGGRDLHARGGAGAGSPGCDAQRRDGAAAGRADRGGGRGADAGGHRACPAGAVGVGGGRGRARGRHHDSGRGGGRGAGASGGRVA